ncbi:hypothetical protein HYPSUDRAFT_205903 [Hypholoma sublateritium FD-334 SS-4]|uniref:F-box domain-containing protein n=1 Tax=Hypholoma sublateritium (strain FD-334 SS-4) TaxID=945553 RepID=A0A0D2NM90_HYPSF|nr:hypothetical protein HYPSUDRAFT_205903 [Hypholoma sublateritium FD-334 SS-4]
MAENPPIHRLSHDLLLHIFEQNAHMFAEKNALITTRTASQVCGNWRSIMLATPFLWGRLLDFDVLARSTGDGYWGDELVRRTGSSVLWIKTEKALITERASRQLAEHFVKTVEENFHRLQILVVDFHLIEWARYRELWHKITSLPAPQLQCFDFTVSMPGIGQRTPTGGDRLSSLPLFADDAPCLRTFRAVQFIFDLQVPWLCGLRDLYIGYSTIHPTLLDALATTESLERLELCSVSFTEDEDDEEDVHLQTVHLPKLKELRLASLHPSVCDILLDQLIIPPDCALQYTLGLARDWFDDDHFIAELTDIIRRLSEYLLCIESGAQDGFGGFNFLISSHLLPRLEQITATFLSEFTLPEFRHVTQLYLEIEFDEETFPLLLPFLGCLSSVQVLTTRCWYPTFFKLLKEKLDPPRSTPAHTAGAVRARRAKQRPSISLSRDHHHHLIPANSLARRTSNSLWLRSIHRIGVDEHANACVFRRTMPARHVMPPPARPRRPTAHTGRSPVSPGT